MYPQEYIVLFIQSFKYYNGKMVVPAIDCILLQDRHGDAPRHLMTGDLCSFTDDEIRYKRCL